MKKFLFLAAVALLGASCADDQFVGDVTNPQDNSPSASDAIVFSSASKGVTRADIYGNEAAKLLGKGFYVTGTKGEEADDSPTPTLVFDNYLVYYSDNTANKTESNTANWEYVGITPGEGSYTNWVKLGTAYPQSIKYWDYTTSQYDFLAFSTGTYKAVKKTTYTGGDALAADEIGVTASKYGSGLAGSATAYTFYLPSVDALKQAYVTDITEVPKGKYGQEVVLKFKSLGSKVRIGLYETIPGYSVKDVQFYQWDDATDITADEPTKVKGTNAALISGNSGGLPTNGTIEVIFPSVGNNNASKQDYNKVAGHVTPIVVAEGGTNTQYKVFGTLSNFAAREINEDAGSYLGRTLPDATFAGESAASYYQTVFPVSSTYPLTLRVDYTLVATDGSGETIKIYGAKAVVPSTYINWLPNYAYTYIFKISDNTNGWTSTATTSDPAGLFPITFDAVVTEATDATGQQTTVTTVATPTITTYQQNHAYTTNEYSIATGTNIYVQVMDNSSNPATLVNNLDNTNSLLYEVSDVNATEADVMDALEMRTTAIDADDVRGRNGLRLTKKSINNAVTTIANGADNQPIPVNAGEAARINLSTVVADRNYAYVYDYTSGSKTTVNEYQPIIKSAGSIIGAGKKKITITTLNGTPVTTSAETINDDSYNYIYFSKTTNGTGTTTYSYISIAGKKGMTLPAGVVKVAKTSLGTTVADEAVNNSTTFYFDTYITNNGKYAVKVIKIVA